MLNRSLKIKKGFVVQKVKEGTIIFDVEKSKLYSLNDTASYIFKCIKSHDSDDDIVKKIINRYDVDPTKAKKETDYFIKYLKSLKIIEERNGSGAT